MSTRRLSRAAVSLGIVLSSGAFVGCSSDASPFGASTPSAGSTGAGGSTGSAGVAGASTGSGGASPSAGASGAATQAGNGNSSGSGNEAGAGNGAGSGNGSAGAAGAAVVDPPAPTTLMVDPNCPNNCTLSFDAKKADPGAGVSGSDTHVGDQQQLSINPKVKPQGKLIIVLGGIGGGPGGGGIEGFAKANGFHVFAVATQTKTSSAPDKYKDMLKTNPMDAEANRQVADARMEAWDGKDRVDWLDIKPPDSIANRTAAALKYGMANAPGGDWDYYLNADGSVRWTDVFMVGYSFGSQTIAMVSKYVRFGRVFLTSGPEDEGFPNATWMSQPSATPVERLFMAVGLNSNYPSADPADKHASDMFDTVKHAGWIGDPIVNVPLLFAGPFNNTHLMAMIGGDGGTSPGGHSIFCTTDPKNGWIAACNYAFGVVK